MVGKTEVKGQLGSRWCKRLDGVAFGVGGGGWVFIFVCMVVCLYRKILAHSLECYGSRGVIQQLL